MMAKGVTDQFSVTSFHLDETLDVLTYLPPHYATENRYPMIIAQDGKDFFQLGRVVRILDELILTGQIEPVLFFGIPYQNVADRYQKYHPAGEKNEAYIQFLYEELLPVIEGKFSVASGGQNRALAGDSLAATVSFMTTLTVPKIFSKVLLFSPYVDDQVLAEARSFQDWNDLTIYHVVGLEERNVKLSSGGVMDFLAENRRLKNIIPNHVKRYFYEEFSGDHTWKYWQKDLPRAFTYLFPKI